MFGFGNGGGFLLIASSEKLRIFIFFFRRVYVENLVFYLKEPFRFSKFLGKSLDDMPARKKRKRHVIGFFILPILK